MRLRYFFVLAVLLFFITGYPSMAQVSHGGKPVSLERKIRADIQRVMMPAVDVPALLAEDEIEEAEGMPFRFGKPIEVNYDLANSGTWEEFPDGSALWRLEIESPGAYSLNLVYDRYWLPPGAKLFIYNGDRSTTLGAFTEQNNKEHGKFATAPVPGDACILEYYEPAEIRRQGDIAISHVVHAYKDIFNFDTAKQLLSFGSSGSCNNNINCPEGEPWQSEKRSVAMILTSYGSRICTGTLINNVRQDRTPFFLTAEHCLGGEETWVFMFNYESPTCENIDGPTWMTVSGSTLLANYSGSDFALLMLDESPPDSYYVYYAGWSNVNTPSQSSTGIHHPSGDIKKISFDYDPVTSANYLTTSGTTHWRIGSWDDGTTEPGSSGSPLFDQDHHVVGQLHGGYASCTSLTSDWYGKFSLSWTGGGTTSTRLRDWLDPYNSGAAMLDGYDPFETVVISHFPLTDTRDTVNDYEVICTIISSAPLVEDSLLLFYQTASVWNTELLVSTGINKQYHAFIPAQSAGTTVEYYLFAKDSAGTADTTQVYSFNIEYTPQISVYPMSINHTLPVEDSVSDYFIIENTGEGYLNYTINIERVMSVNPFYDSLDAAGLLAPATHEYPDGFDDNYIEVKGLEDYRVGFEVDKNAGGPDLYGYYWIDSDEGGGPVFNWMDITATGTDITAGLDDDNFIGPFDLGFSLPYYDSAYTQFYVGSNGLIGFDTTALKSRTKVSIPTSSTPNAFLAWLWDDLDITNLDNPGGAVYMQSDGQKCIIQFVNYPEYNGDAGDVINAEVIIESDGTITYQYNSIATGFDIGSCAVGIENQEGTDGLEVAYLTTYLKESLAVRFDRPAQWLTFSKYGGAVWTGLSDTIICTVSSVSLDTGLYYSNAVIANNDPDPTDSLWPVPIMLTVTDIPPFICGDVNDDEAVNILDVTYLVTYLYRGGPAPVPPQSADVNNSGNINLLDVTYLITYLYKSGPDPNCP